MPLSALKATQLASLLAGHSKLFTANNPGQNEFANYLLGSAQSAQMGLLAEEEEKKRKKKEKGLFGGKLGSALGSAAGIALAGPTLGASLGLSAAAGGALAGSIGGGLGGIAGQYLAGGSPSGQSIMLDAAQGGLSGYAYGKSGELGTSVQAGATQPDIPASPPIEQKIQSSIANALPGSGVLGPIIGTGVERGTGPLRMPSDAYGVAPGSGPMLAPGTAGVATPAPRAGFGARFGSALSHVMQPQQQMQQRRRYFTLPDGREFEY